MLIVAYYRSTRHTVFLCIFCLVVEGMDFLWSLPTPGLFPVYCIDSTFFFALTQIEESNSNGVYWAVQFSILSLRNIYLIRVLLVFPVEGSVGYWSWSGMPLSIREMTWTNIKFLIVCLIFEKMREVFFGKFNIYFFVKISFTTPITLLLKRWRCPVELIHSWLDEFVNKLKMEEVELLFYQQKNTPKEQLFHFNGCCSSLGNV